MKKILKWIGTDGLLHFMVCYAMLLTFTPIVGLWWALAIVCVASVGKEAWDFLIEKDNDKEAVIHDLVCDVAGAAMAMATICMWNFWA